jgi:hypothetical protein
MKKYGARSVAEGLAIVAACVAASKVFSPAIYESHGTDGAWTYLANKQKRYGICRPLPKDALVSQFVWVNFRGPLNYYMIVHLIGIRGKAKKIDWTVRSVSTPGWKTSVLSEDERRGLSTGGEKSFVRYIEIDEEISRVFSGRSRDGDKTI